MSDEPSESEGEPWSLLTASVMKVVENALILVEYQLAHATDQDLAQFIIEWGEMKGWSQHDRRLAWWVRPRARREQQRRETNSG